MKGQNWPISCIKKYRDIRRYRDIFWCFQTMQYIAFAIYRDTKRSALLMTYLPESLDQAKSNLKRQEIDRDYKSIPNYAPGLGADFHLAFGGLPVMGQ